MISTWPRPHQERSEVVRKALRQRALDEDKSMNELIIELLTKAVSPRK